jgi:hypothetical protein
MSIVFAGVNWTKYYGSAVSMVRFDLVSWFSTRVFYLIFTEVNHS